MLQYIDMSTAEEVAGILLDINAITLSPQKPFRFASGILSPIYSDHRQLLGYPEKRRRIISLMAEEVKKIGMPNFVAGTAMGAIPHAAWVSDILNIPMVYVRNKPKDHGKQNLIEGFYEAGQTAVVVEDLISSASSSIASVLALREALCTVSHIVCITTYGFPESIKNLEQGGITLHNLTDFGAIIQVAVERQLIGATEHETALDWIKNPSAWGHKMGFE
jgi:orotate phosphoribosyltransferase